MALLSSAYFSLLPWLCVFFSSSLSCLPHIWHALLLPLYRAHTKTLSLGWTTLHLWAACPVGYRVACFSSPATPYYSSIPFRPLLRTPANSTRSCYSSALSAHSSLTACMAAACSSSHLKALISILTPSFLYIFCLSPFSCEGVGIAGRIFAVGVGQTLNVGPAYLMPHAAAPTTPLQPVCRLFLPHCARHCRLCVRITPHRFGSSSCARLLPAFYLCTRAHCYTHRLPATLLPVLPPLPVYHHLVVGAF